MWKMLPDSNVCLYIEGDSRDGCLSVREGNFIRILGSAVQGKCFGMAVLKPENICSDVF